VAIDVNKGEIAWSVPLGTNRALAELGEGGLRTGVPNIGGTLATASGPVFVGTTSTGVSALSTPGQAKNSGSPTCSANAHAGCLAARALNEPHHSML
jgi:quinoprotein glucose dehydrogenase